MIIYILHCIAWIISTFYGFIFSKNWLDMYYLYITFLLALHWTILRGECLISLIDKWKEESTYKMGTNPEPSDLIDIYDKKYSRYMWFVWKIFQFFKVVSIYIVLKRNKIKHSEWIIFIFTLYFLKKINTYIYHLPFCILFIIILFNLKKY